MASKPTRRPARRRSAAGTSNASPESELQVVPSYTLPSHLTIAQAAPLHHELCSLAEAGGELTVDAAAVERIDAACLQILLAARGTLEAAGRRFQVVSPSDFFCHAAALLGLAEHLGVTSSTKGNRP